MKTRLGFVSNSSSSSFTLVTSKTNHDKVLASMADRERMALEIFGQFQEGKTLFGIPIVVMSYMSGNYGDYVYDNCHEDERWEEFSEGDRDAMSEIWEVVEKYQEEVQKDEGDCFSHSDDF
jgi:hypothetical protein